MFEGHSCIKGFVYEVEDGYFVAGHTDTTGNMSQVEGTLVDKYGEDYDYSVQHTSDFIKFVCDDIEDIPFEPKPEIKYHEGLVYEDWALDEYDNPEWVYISPVEDIYDNQDEMEEVDVYLLDEDHNKILDSDGNPTIDNGHCIIDFGMEV